MPTISTIQMSKLPKGAALAEALTYRVPDLAARFIDTTTRANHPLFAPGWDIVMGHKNGTLSDQQYTEIYLMRMQASYRAWRDEWHRLLKTAALKDEDIVLICYCPAERFCHRHQLAEMLLKVAEQLGLPFDRGGEFVGR